MKNFIKQFVIWLPLSLALCAAPVKAEVTGWLTPDVMHPLSRKKAGEEKLMPIKIECRGDSRSSSVRESMEIRMTFAPNTANKRWRWGWGANFTAIKLFWEKHGWTQISASSFRRPKTGLLVPCGIFHKDRS